jgi:choline dehydrogenase
MDASLQADVIVVGAGSAGCALAARLSEDPGTRVLLLEAGGEDRNIWIHIPIGYGKTITDPSVNWCYETEPEPQLGGRRVFWPRGKVLGGSSSINGLVYIRGQAEDFDHWRQLGNAGWSYQDVLPYFRRAENQTRGGDAYHGTEGPLTVSDLREKSPLCDAFIASAMQAGLPRNDDFNGANQEGVGYFQLTTRNGRRCSTAVAYLRPAMKRANLQVLTGALTRRVLIEGGRAVGVEFERDGAVQQARAAREVVLCGGAINSPQLLMLSGIGPAAHLSANGIAVAHDLPGVGRNLQDHYQARITLKCTRPVTVNDIMRSPWRKAKMALEYALFRSGALTTAAGQVGAFARTRPELASPDVQFHFISFSADRPAEGLHPFPGFMLSVCQLRPESAGEILLRGPDPKAPPVIHANYLATETDRRTMVEGLKLARKLVSAGPIRDYIADEYLPGAKVQTDEQLLDYIRSNGGTIYHPAGTCRMGADPMAVVDSELRVRGIGGLRVADASVMPTVVSGNTNAACIMIGEKLAAMMRGEASQRAAA